MALPEIIKELLENGVHFGHLGKHWNPRMKPFIFGKKKDVYIINLEKTAQKIEEAKDFVKSIAEKGGHIFFVATKRQLRDVMKDFAISCKMPYVTERWVGGLLTNFVTIRTRVNAYLQLLEKRDSGEFNKMLKKEVVRLNRVIERMDKNYRGVGELDSLPECIFLVDPKREAACVREANKLGIPIVALIDTDANPDIIDYPIPGNDDAIKSVKCITSKIVEAIKEGLSKQEELIKKSEQNADLKGIVNQEESKVMPQANSDNPENISGPESLNKKEEE